MSHERWHRWFDPIRSHKIHPSSAPLQEYGTLQAMLAGNFSAFGVNKAPPEGEFDGGMKVRYEKCGVCVRDGRGPRPWFYLSVIDKFPVRFSNLAVTISIGYDDVLYFPSFRLTSRDFLLSTESGLVIVIVIEAIHNRGDSDEGSSQYSRIITYSKENMIITIIAKSFALRYETLTIRITTIEQDANRQHS
ncbi:hypothetical protein KQX54_005486 [Cotesia glomerata]|uniref:Uncharacterized protein n=1 Tax=Cotesia glomerata TaxID=32391 RepID=A0AAV7HVP4_COTGL|nr:hypothetical protein KQX54_005486 [Cotesia glomerata]